MNKDLHNPFSHSMVLGQMVQGVDHLEKTGLARKIGQEDIFAGLELVDQSALAIKDAAGKWIAAAPNTQLSRNIFFWRVKS